MSVTIGHINFDRVEFDADGDVLYLHVGDPSRAVASMRRLKDMRCA